MRSTALLIFLFIILSACQRSPTGRRQLAIASDSQMEQMGTQAFAEMKAKQSVESDAKMNAYVQCVAHAITNTLEPKQDWEVVVFKEPSANAFALPGGKIGVYTGLMKVAKNQHQLAAVIGHEVGHVVAEHGKERVSETLLAQGGLAVASAVISDKSHPKHDLLLAALGIGTQVGVLLPHSRTQESEADVIGLDLMARAGFEPKEAVALWHNMEASGGGQPPQFLSDHPSHENRIQTLQSKMPEAEKEFKASPHHPNCGSVPG
jgi:predicted Zn-dependent protease